MAEDPHPVVGAPVTVVVPPLPNAPVTAGMGLVAPPTATEEMSRMTAGQRETSLMWEKTQRQLALGFLCTALICATVVVIASIFITAERVQSLALVSMTFLTSTSCS